MKFGKALEAQAKEIPEALSSVLLNYKALKKKIKAIPAADGEGGCQSEAEADFVRTLNADVQKFNELFMDKEEIAVMKLASLAEDVQRLKKSLEAEKGNTISLSSRASALMRSLVDFHGDLVLTLHWSLINYSALSKILKKHDKRTGVQIRQPYLTSILQQPFNSTSILSRLVKRAETLVEEAGALGRSIHSSSLEEPELEDAPDALDPITSQPKSKKQQRAKNALDMWENLAKSASTPSTIGVGIKRSAEGQPADAIAKQIKKI